MAPGKASDSADSDTPGNLLLAALGEGYSRLRSRMEHRSLRMRETLQEAGDPVEWVYFPTSGIISVLNVLENGMTVEFATVGKEGTTGASVFLGITNPNISLISQVQGEALRMRTEDFIAAFERDHHFAAILTRYSGLMLAFVSQSAACNRAHQVDARCAKWLLMTQDEVGSDSFPITQEFLAQMLGVSRPSVALSAEALQRSGLISYHRGRMTIVDRARLEEAACECYGIMQERFQQFHDSLSYGHRGHHPPHCGGA